MIVDFVDLCVVNISVTNCLKMLEVPKSVVYNRINSQSRSIPPVFTSEGCFNTRYHRLTKCTSRYDVKVGPLYFSNQKKCPTQKTFLLDYVVVALMIHLGIRDGLVRVCNEILMV